MFRHRRQLRHWAARLLLLWLFGIGAGVANGCIAADAAWSDGLSAAHGAAVVEAHTHAAGTAGDGHRHASHAPPHPVDCDHQGTPAKTNCRDFCDKTTMSIPPLKSALDHAEGPALAPREIAMACAYMASTCDRSWEPRRDGARAPPITIAFLRLAL